MVAEGSTRWPAVGADCHWAGGRRERQRSTLPVYASQIAIAVLVIHIGFSVLATVVTAACTCHNAMAAGGHGHCLQSHSSGQPTQPPAYSRTSTSCPGRWAAWLSRRSGSDMPTRVFLDRRRIPVFLIAGVTQLLVRYSNASSVNSLHQSSPMPWGVTSVVAGGLVVAALIVIARSASLGSNRKYAVTRRSRRNWRGPADPYPGSDHRRMRRGRSSSCGQDLAGKNHKAASVGVEAPVLWTQQLMVRLLSRVLAIVIPVAGFIAIEHVTDLRAQVNSQVHTNIDIRFQMYRLAWEEFLRSPLTGTGWASFRECHWSIPAKVKPSHTIWWSPCFRLVACCHFHTWRFWPTWRIGLLRHGGPYTAAVAASIAVSMTQPFFESTVCNLIFLPIAFLAGLSNATTEGDDAMSAKPRAGANRKRLRSTRSVHGASRARASV